MIVIVSHDNDFGLTTPLYNTIAADGILVHWGINYIFLDNTF